MNPYDCWHQAGIKSDVAIGAQAKIIAPADGPDGLIVQKAAAEYKRLMSSLFGKSAAVSSEISPSGAAAADGFTITVSPKGDVAIAGGTEAGALYGVYRFMHLLATGKISSGDTVMDAPVSRLRMVNHWDNTDGTIERGYAGPSIFYKDQRFAYDPQRLEDYARLLASIGINRLSINNVNAKDLGARLITDDELPEVAKIAAIFRPYGIKLLLSINFAAPYVLDGLPTADPLDGAVAQWWKDRAAAVYRHVPDLAGFLVKADAEGEPGPFQYGRTHADGANMLAAALVLHHGVLIWRCFVYDCGQDWRDKNIDRARAAYDNFMPLDGKFAENVILQIKHGPYDFQVREPVSPLFGALAKTRYVMELQVTQEYTGHQIDLCYLPWMWQDVMSFDTGHPCKGNRPRPSTAAVSDLMEEGTIEGLAAVGNVGLDANWTGHTLAQANLYGYGRLAWNPRLNAGEIAEEWSRLTFGGTPGAKDAAGTVADILLRSYPAYEKYNAPFGLCFMVTPNGHYGPSPEGYEFSRWGTYHRADKDAIGIDRTKNGTDYTGQYASKNAALFADVSKCPENLILFFHRLAYGYTMKNGETLLQNIYGAHFEGCDEAASLLASWETLENKIDDGVYRHTLARFQAQLDNAKEWRDVINTYFFRKTGIPDARGRQIYP